jgi:antitoxin ParD1/3/4
MDPLSVSLPADMKEFVEREVRAGGFATADEYVRALLRTEQQRKARENIEALLLEGVRSNSASPMTRQDWDEIRNEVRERHAKRNGL